MNGRMDTTDQKETTPLETDDDSTGLKFLKLGVVCLMCLGLAAVAALIIQTFIA